MQIQHARPLPRNQAQATTSSPSASEPLSDAAVVALLGGLYLGGLATVVGALYAVSALF
jgi:hypothetical protein